MLTPDECTAVLLTLGVAARSVAPPAATAALAGSTRSPVFHKASCSALAAIMEANLVSYASREEAIQAGKRPCPKCQP